MIMEDSTFELLTKMYSEMNKQFGELNNKLDKKADKSDIARFENGITPKVETLFDGYRQLTEGQQEIKSQLAELSSNVEKQDIQITVLKSGKNAAR